jgi:hypothetical protein
MFGIIFKLISCKTNTKRILINYGDIVAIGSLILSLPHQQFLLDKIFENEIYYIYIFYYLMFLYKVMCLKY